MTMSLDPAEFQVLPLEQCLSRLAWRVPSRWNPLLPGVAINGHAVVTGETDQRVMNWQMGQEQALEFFCSLYSEFSIYHWWRLADFFGRLPEGHSFPFALADLMSRCRVSESREWRLALAVLDRAPSAFGDWVLGKKLQARDLLPLSFWPESLWQSGLLAATAASSLSKSEAVQCFEYFGDLAQMPVNLDPVLGAAPGDWPKLLKELRFAETNQRDAGATAALANLSRSKGLSWQWVRQGDQSGVSVQTFARSPQELERQVQSLQNLVSHWPESLS